MTFIKLHYLLAHELLVLSAQGDMHMGSPECFCSSAAGSNSGVSFTAGTGNIPAPLEPCVSHVPQCRDSPQDGRTQDQENQNPLGWERPWSSSLLSWIECCLHLPVGAAKCHSYTSGVAMNAPQISWRWSHNVTSFFCSDSEVSAGEMGRSWQPFPHSCCCEHVQSTTQRPWESPQWKHRHQWVFGCCEDKLEISWAFQL